MPPANNSSELFEIDFCHGCGYLNQTWTARFYSIPVFVISLLTLIGNSLVVFVILKNKRTLYNNQGMFMLSLAISDLGSGLSFLVFGARYSLTNSGPSSGLELDLGAGISYLFLTATLLTTLAIGLDKLAQIEAPFSYERRWSTKRCLLLIVFYWVLIGLLSVLPTRNLPIPNYFYRYNPNTLTFVTVHNSKPSYLVIVRISLFLSLIGTLTVGYGRLYCIARRHQAQLNLSLNFRNQNGESQPNRRNTRGTLTIALVLVAFVVVWLPLFVLHISLALLKSEKHQWSKNAEFGLTWFAMMHTFLNVLIYGGTYRPFRIGLMRSLNMATDTNSFSIDKLSARTNNRNELVRQSRNHLMRKDDEISLNNL